MRARAQHRGRPREQVGERLLLASYGLKRPRGVDERPLQGALARGERGGGGVGGPDQLGEADPVLIELSRQPARLGERGGQLAEQLVEVERAGAGEDLRAVADDALEVAPRRGVVGVEQLVDIDDPARELRREHCAVAQWGGCERARLHVDVAVGDARLSGGPDLRPGSGVQRRVASVGDRQRDVGLPVGGEIHRAHGPHRDAGDLDAVADHELPGVEESRVQRVVGARVEDSERSHGQRRRREDREAGESDRRAPPRRRRSGWWTRRRRRRGRR